MNGVEYSLCVHTVQSFVNCHGFFVDIFGIAYFLALFVGSGETQRDVDALCEVDGLPGRDIF